MVCLDARGELYDISAWMLRGKRSALRISCVFHKCPRALGRCRAKGASRRRRGADRQDTLGRAGWWYRRPRPLESDQWTGWPPPVYVLLKSCVLSLSPLLPRRTRVEANPLVSDASEPLIDAVSVTCTELTSFVSIFSLLCCHQRWGQSSSTKL